MKLGLAGGPLIVAILISRFGPHYKLVTYTTMSANLMLREVGIALFLACVGLDAGSGWWRRWLMVVTPGLGMGLLLLFCP